MNQFDAYIVEYERSLGIVSSESELKDMCFSELFFKVSHTPEVCDAIIGRLYPGARDDVERARAAAIELELLREHLESLFKQKYGFGTCTALQVRRSESIEDSRLPSANQIREILLEYCAYCKSKEDEREIGAHTERLLFNVGRAISFTTGIEEEQRRIINQSLCDKVIKGLEAVSHIESDQELIVCLGKLFHVRMREIDAYTGLVYTSECLDCDEILYRDAFLSFSVVEKERQALQMKEGHLAFQI